MSIKLLAFGVAALMASTAQAAVTVYNSQAAFAAALGSSVVEDFSDTNLVTGLSFTTNAGSVGGGVFSDRVYRGGDQTTFNFAKATTGFGAFFDEAPGGFGQACCSRSTALPLFRLSCLVLPGRSLASSRRTASPRC